MLVVFVGTMLVMIFGILREIAYAFRNNARIRKLVPQWLLDAGLLSFGDLEVNDGEKAKIWKQLNAVIVFTSL